LTAFNASSLTVAEKQIVRDKAFWMTLECVAVSQEAVALVERLRFQPSGGKPSSFRKAQEATGAILADLVIADREGVWSKRTLRSNDFKGLHIGYRPFIAALEALEGVGLVDRLAGYTDRSGFGPVGRPSCFRLSEQGKALVVQTGIDPQNSIAVHFKRRPLGENVGL
jgi:hypothetical protein